LAIATPSQSEKYNHLTLSRWPLSNGGVFLDPIDFLLTDRLNAAAAKRFFPRALRNDNSMPGVINVDKNPAYPSAVTGQKADGTINRRCRLRQGKYLNNIVEQDHRNVKRRTFARQRLRFATDVAHFARNQGNGDVGEGQSKVGGQGNVVGQVNFIRSLLGIAA
jgi:IS6 family transposase